MSGHATRWTPEARAKHSASVKAGRAAQIAAAGKREVLLPVRQDRIPATWVILATIPRDEFDVLLFGGKGRAKP